MQPQWRMKGRTDAHEKGATAVEYALMIGLIAIAIVVAVTALGLSVSAMMQPAANTLSP